MSAASGPTRRLVLARPFAAPGAVLGLLSMPAGGARVFPFRYAINAVAGVAVGLAYLALQHDAAPSPSRSGPFS